MDAKRIHWTRFERLKVLLLPQNILAYHLAMFLTEDERQRKRETARERERERERERD